MALTDEQLDQVLSSAKLVNKNARDAYLKSIANRLHGVDTPTNEQITAAIRFVLGTRGVYVGRKVSIERLTENAI